MGLILDTSILVAAERGRFRFPEFCRAHGSESLFIAAITASELLHGVERATPPERRTARSSFVEYMLLTLPIVDFDLAVARTHAKVWASLVKAGRVIGAHDIQIAATAIEHGFVLASLNVAEFERVEGLRLVDVESFRQSPTN